MFIEINVGITIVKKNKITFENRVIEYCLLQLLHVIVWDTPHMPLKTLRQLILFKH
jgi:hypothetical protein